MRNLSIAKRIPLVIVFLSIAAAVVTGSVTYIQSSSFLRQNAEQHLEVLLAARYRAMEEFFDGINNDLALQRVNRAVIDGLIDFKAIWDQLGEDPTATLQQLYIEENPFPPDRRYSLDDAGDGSTYSIFHREFNPSVRNFILQRGYYDMFLFDVDGNLIYTFFKEADFATNFNTGPWRETSLAEAYRAVRKNPDPSFVSVQDFAPYAPSQYALASFIATSVLDYDANIIGVLAYQLPVDQMNAVMQVTAGMGETGETYLVGGDLLMRSDSRFSEQSTILQARVDTAPVHRALEGESGIMLTPDYRGISVLSAYDRFSFLDLNWAILAEVDETEILGPLTELRASMYWVVALSAVVISIFGSILAMNITRPLIEIRNTILRLADDDLSATIPNVDSTDELGDVRRALLVFKENAIRRMESEERIRHLANHDDLTGLPTRRLAKDRLESAIISSKRHNWNVAVAFLDLDSFKPVNDNFGHDIGDGLLMEVAARLKANLREGDTVARLGGDEFLIILGEIKDAAVATMVVKKMVAAISQPFDIGGYEIKIGASFGISLYPEHGENVEELINKADTSMYEAKHSSKTRLNQRGR